MGAHNQSSVQAFPRFWRQKRWAKRAINGFHNLVRGIAENRLVALVLPWIAGSYFLILDVWGDEWTWIKNHQEMHEGIFWFLLVCSLGSLFIRGIVRPPQALETDATAREVEEALIATVGTIVQTKLLRYRQALPTLKPHSDKLRKLADPRKQIETIAELAARFIRENFGLKEDQISITVLRKTPTSKWHYHYQHHPDWSHTSAEPLMATNSAAAAALNTGENIFLVDKIRAADEGHFTLSDRDRRRGDGSAFVYPIKLATSSGEYAYIVSFVTYDRQLCEDFQTQTAEIAESCLREICRRFEIELSLDALESSLTRNDHPQKGSQQ